MRSEEFTVTGAATVLKLSIVCNLHPPQRRNNCVPARVGVSQTPPPPFFSNFYWVVGHKYIKIGQ